MYAIPRANVVFALVRANVLVCSDDPLISYLPHSQPMICFQIAIDCGVVSSVLALCFLTYTLIVFHTFFALPSI